MYKTQYINSLLVTALLALAGCSNNGVDPFTQGGGVSTVTGVVSQKNFSVLTSDFNPKVIDSTDGSFTKTDLTITAFIGDRNNRTLGDAHTIYFVSEYGLIDPNSCVTVNGSCSVTWSAITPPVAGGPASDYLATVTGYTIGEEAFTDSNGNGTFDDGETFSDIEEPYLDADNSGTFNAGDIIIDVISTNDPTGVNGQHDLADSFFNGGGCTHSSLCGVRASTMVFSAVTMLIIQ